MHRALRGTGDDVDRKKPDPKIYKMAAERLGVSPEECVVVEDSMIGLQVCVHGNSETKFTKEGWATVWGAHQVETVFRSDGIGSAWQCGSEPWCLISRAPAYAVYLCARILPSQLREDSHFHLGVGHGTRVAHAGGNRRRHAVHYHLHAIHQVSGDRMLGWLH